MWNHKSVILKPIFAPKPVNFCSVTKCVDMYKVDPNEKTCMNPTIFISLSFKCSFYAEVEDPLSLNQFILQTKFILGPGTSKYSRFQLRDYKSIKESSPNFTFYIKMFMMISGEIELNSLNLLTIRSEIFRRSLIRYWSPKAYCTQNHLILLHVNVQPVFALLV